MIIESIQQVNVKIENRESFILKDAVDVLNKIYDLVPDTEATVTLLQDLSNEIEFLHLIIEDGISVQVSTTKTN